MATGFEFNLDLNKVKQAQEAIAERAKAQYGERADKRMLYVDQVGKQGYPDEVFYRLIPFDLTPANGLTYFDQVGWFLEHHRIVSATSIGEQDDAMDMYLAALEMAKTDEGIAAIIHKDNYAKFQFSSQYLAPVIELKPVIENGIFMNAFEVDEDPKKAIRMGCFRESLWTQVLTVTQNAFNNPGVTVYGPDARVWQSLKTNENNQVRYKTERIEFTFNPETAPSFTEAHKAELLEWQTGGAYEFFKEGVTPAEERMEWMNYIFQGEPRPKNARPLKEEKKKQQFGGSGTGGGLMGKLKK